MSTNFFKEADAKYHGRFRQALESGSKEEIQKLAEVSSEYIKDRIYEVSFTDAIIPAKMIGKGDLDQHESNEPVKYMELQPNVEASVLNFRGKPRDEYLRTAKAAVPFYMVASDHVIKSEYELMTLRSPVTTIIEEIMLKQIAAQKDARFVEELRKIIAYLVGKGEAADIGVANFSLEAVTEAANRFVDAKLNLGCFLTNAKTFNKWFGSALENNKYGDIQTDKMMTNGFDQVTIGKNWKWIVTNKTELVSDNEMFAFVTPEYLGVNYVLQDVKFQIDKDMQMIDMVSWASFGVGIGNIRGVCRVSWP